jgi:hypothetical protein
MARNVRINRQRQKPSLEDEIAHLRDLDPKGLRVRWKGIFKGQAPSHFPRHLLFGVLAYRMQADALGDLDVATIRLLKQIAAGGTKIDSVALTAEFDRRRSELKPGTILMREWNGRLERVRVIDEALPGKARPMTACPALPLRSPGRSGMVPGFLVYGTNNQIRQQSE